MGSCQTVRGSWPPRGTLPFTPSPSAPLHCLRCLSPHCFPLYYCVLALLYPAPLYVNTDVLLQLQSTNALLRYSCVLKAWLLRTPSSRPTWRGSAVSTSPAPSPLGDSRSSARTQRARRIFEKLVENGDAGNATGCCLDTPSPPRPVFSD